ncbi:MAG: vitamin K epoxide reductase family protein [Anaerolineales bacterium]|nr:vitamin K epoxide reductase family protein [Anaerolineales bacterium]
MLKKALLGLAVIGLLDSIYLTTIKVFSGGVCVAGSQCEIVNSSIYSSIAGIPIALLGAGAYLVMIGVLLMEGRHPFFTENGPVILLGLTFFGVVYSAYLTYLELFIIRAICPFCVLSAVVLLVMFILAAIRFQRTMQELPA